MSFTIVRQDITKMKVDAIVNAANTNLRMGGGVCGAIFKAAGAAQLQDACNILAPIRTGDAVITPAFLLSSKFIIHTAGPVYQDGRSGEQELLYACYLNSLKRAVENACESIAFPLISSGIFGYPKEEALQVASAAIQQFLGTHDLKVSLVVFDKASFVVSKALLSEVESYIDDHYVENHQVHRRTPLDIEIEPLAESVWYQCEEPLPRPGRPGLDDLIGNLDESFPDMLLRLVKAKGKTEVEVYKHANLDRKLFSKIRTGKDYLPSKRTAIALAVSLGLTRFETDDFLKRAGFALSHSQKFDVIVEFFIVRGNYDIFEINEVLFKYDQPLLGM